jgi:hypothetical protein
MLVCCSEGDLPDFLTTSMLNIVFKCLPLVQFHAIHQSYSEQNSTVSRLLSSFVVLVVASPAFCATNTGFQSLVANGGVVP